MQNTAPNRPMGHTPPRRAQSIRRTSTLDTDWPSGREGNLRVRGRARDVVTTRLHDSPRTLLEHSVEATISPRREILAITSDQVRPTLVNLIGVRAGGHLRGALEEALPDDKRRTTPLNLLLDDLAGASLVANWIWSRWVPDWEAQVRNMVRSGPDGKPILMAGVCTGFAPGSSSLNEDGSPNTGLQNYAHVTGLRNPDDLAGWHAFADQSGGAAVRRARCTDVWLDQVIHVALQFQDSGTLPQGGRAAVHEYHVQATLDPETMQLLTLSADPRVLPFAECPSATVNITRLIGRPVSEFRRTVIDLLPGTLGCTHLNDVLRSLADVPNLVAAFRTHRG